MLRGGQSDNLSFKGGGMTKRSMPPPFMPICSLWPPLATVTMTSVAP